MRIAHVGNVANIAYLNVKFLRRLGVDAHLYYYDFDLCLGQPEWEEAIIEGECDVLERNWREKMLIRDYKSPNWAHAINMKPCRDVLRVSVPFADRDRPGLKGFLGRWEHRINRVLPAWQQHRVIMHALRHRGVNVSLSVWESVRHFDIYRFREIVEHYDLVQVYGTEPISCLSDFPRLPFIAYEFGTMRDIPFEGSVRGKLLTAAYQQAERVIVTNADVRVAVERLGLDNSVFIPHPVDEEKFCPGPSVVRAKLEERYGQDVVVLFAPARHDWEVKGNDKIIRAFARLVGEERKPIVMILITWGEEVAKSREIIRAEGIEEYVLWQSVLPKVQIVDYYRAADVVLDQFNIGTFGLITAEAMACGKPVVMHFVPAIHECYFPEPPPIVSACTEEEIGEKTKALIRDSARRVALGERARQWVCQHHGWETVARRHVQLYQEVLGESSGAYR